MLDSLDNNLQHIRVLYLRLVSGASGHVFNEVLLQKFRAISSCVPSAPIEVLESTGAAKTSTVAFCVSGKCS